MKSFAFAALFAAANALSSVEYEYMNYCAEFGKVSNDVEEFNFRMENFAAVDAFIQEHNASNASYTAGHNQFSDWSHAEYKSILGYVRGEADVRSPVLLDESANADTVNWVTAGAVNAVKDQGQCGSCWAFSSTCALEGAHFVASGELLSFAEQQLVDCAGLKYGNMGCNGGLQTNAYKYYAAGNDAILESDYAYTAKDGHCQYDSKPHTDVLESSLSDVTVNNVAQMKAAVTKSVLAVAIEADKMCFQTYKSGIFDNSKCGTTLDHAVAVVGYGTDAGQEYWIMRNSWNTTWGDKGYMKMAITGDDAGICGVQSDPQLPTSN
jgi:cathepsin L